MTQKTREDIIEEIRQEIVDYADNDKECGWITVYSGKNYRIPKRAAIHYFMGKTIANLDLLPEYEAFSPSGLKMQLDDRNHSDVILGMGFDLDYDSAYSEEVQTVLFKAGEIIEEEFKKIINFDFTILANNQEENYIFSIMVYEYERELKENVWSSTHISCFESDKGHYKSCIVIPEASVKYEEFIKNADIIITENGSAGSHLAVLSRESGKILIKVKDAVDKFPVFTKFSLNMNSLEMKLDTNV